MKFPRFAACRFGLCLGLLWALAARASADLPFSASVCKDPADVVSSLADPNAFATDPHCPALCGRFVADCSRFVKLAGACQVAQIDAASVYARRTCNTVHAGAPREACLSSVASFAADRRAGARVHTRGVTDECLTHAAICRGACQSAQP
jgi:hypothetical protein